MASHWYAKLANNIESVRVGVVVGQAVMYLLPGDWSGPSVHGGNYMTYRGRIRRFIGQIQGTNVIGPNDDIVIKYHTLIEPGVGSEINAVKGTSGFRIQGWVRFNKFPDGDPRQLALDETMQDRQTILDGREHIISTNVCFTPYEFAQDVKRIIFNPPNFGGDDDGTDDTPLEPTPVPEESYENRYQIA